MIDLRDDGGTTLFEVLISIVIMGLAFASLLFGIQIGITSSDTHRRQADANAVLVSASEKVKADPTPAVNPTNGVGYRACARGESNPGGLDAGGTAYQTAARSVSPLPSDGTPSGAWTSGTIHVDLVEYWQPTTATFTSDPTKCLDSAQVVHIQRITLKVVSPANVNQVIQKLSIIKRDST